MASTHILRVSLEEMDIEVSVEPDGTVIILHHSTDAPYGFLINITKNDWEQIKGYVDYQLIKNG